MKISNTLYVCTRRQKRSFFQLQSKQHYHHHHHERQQYPFVKLKTLRTTNSITDIATSTVAIIATTTSTNTTIRNFCCCSVIDKIAEDKIATWLREGGAKNLKHSNNNNKNNNQTTTTKQQSSTSSSSSSLYQGDKHQDLAKTLGVGQDYIHSKLLADNNFKPLSIQRRLELDKAWEITSQEIIIAYQKVQQQESSSSSSSSLPLSVSEFLATSIAKSFQSKIQELDIMAKKCNDAIIDDSMRFNGRSPVRHARRFQGEERIREVIESYNNNSINNNKNDKK